MLIGGAWRAASDSYEIREPYRNTMVARAPRSPLSDLNDVLDAAVAAKAKAAATPV
jgi:acyl-CoA reductase-like NAD-dependent aldehyde dehydrogenase